MDRIEGPRESNSLIISYKELGTISLEEFSHALIEHIQALEEIYNMSYVRGARLKLYATNEYAEPVRIRRPVGGTIKYMDMHHYRPACKDYDLRERKRNQADSGGSGRRDRDCNHHVTST